MNAIKFIKDHGVEKAREVVEGAPENSICYDLEQQKHVAYEDTSIAMSFIKNRFIDLSDLKRLVESVDLVELLGGIKSLKGLVDISNSPFALSHITREGVIYSMDEIKQAIADYEAIGGEHV